MRFHPIFRAAVATALVPLSGCAVLDRPAPSTFTGAAEVTPVVTEHSFGLQCLGSIVEESRLEPILVDVKRIRDRTIPDRLNDISRLSQAGEWLVHTAISKLETDRVRSTIGDSEPSSTLTISGAWTQDDELLRRRGGLLNLGWLRGRLNLSGQETYDYIAGDFVSSQNGVVIFSAAIGVALGSSRAEARLLVENGDEFAEVGFEGRWADGPQLAQRRIAEAATMVHIANYYQIDYRPCLENGLGNPAAFRQSLADYADLPEIERNKAAQRELTRIGYAPGDVDGVWGSGSRQALMVYQAENRLPATGELSPVMFALLKAEKTDIRVATR